MKTPLARLPVLSKVAACFASAFSSLHFTYFHSLITLFCRFRDRQEHSEDAMAADPYAKLNHEYHYIASCPDFVVRVIEHGLADVETVDGSGQTVCRDHILTVSAY